MPIDLKAYQKTLYAGLYRSKEVDSDGVKYMGRFQHNGKKYVKVIGYSIKDGIDEKRAHELFLEYKNSVIYNQELTHQKDSPTEKQPPISIDEIQEIVEPYWNLFNYNPKKIEYALKNQYYNEVLKPYQVELIKMQEYLNNKGKKMIILFEGRDASGKGGAIRKITRYMNSKHYRIVALGKPSNTQKTQWYFQRYVEQFPIAGEVIIFDRSWYNRAMVEPVFGFCTPKEYDDFLLDVKQFEKSIVRNNIILVKIYFSVSKSVQERRFNRRSKDPLRQWKLSEVDLQAQELWEAFSAKKYKMLEYSEIEEAPWYIIRSDDKILTRLESIKVILNAVDYPRRNSDLNFESNESVVFNAIQELNTMHHDKY